MRLIFAFILATVVNFATAQVYIENVLQDKEITSITTNRGQLTTTIEFAPEALLFANQIEFTKDYVATWVINHTSTEDLDAFVAAIDTSIVIVEANISRKITELQNRKSKVDGSKGKVPNARRN